MTEIDPIQAQLIAARRNQILDAATKVFAEKGFSRATIKDVAKAARIADGTIYNYFDNKPALLMGILDRLNETAQRETDFAQAAKQDFREWVKSYVRQRFQVFQGAGFEVFRVLLSEILVDEKLRDLYFQKIIKPTYDMAEKFFQQWVDEGAIKPLDPRLTMRVISAAFLGLMMLYLIGDAELADRWDEISEIFTAITLDGLTPGGSDE